MATPVQEAQAIVKRLATIEKRTEPDRWRLAELTFNSGMTARAWGKEIGVSAMTANRYKRIWERWGQDVTQGYTRPSFTECWDIVRGPATSAPLPTPTPTAPIMATPMAVAPTSMSPAEKVKLTERLVLDPDVPAAVVNNARTARQWVDKGEVKPEGAIEQVERATEMAARYNERTRQEKLRPKEAEPLVWVIARGELGMARKYVNQFVAQTNNLTFTDEILEILNHEIERLEQSIQLAKAAIGGTADLDWDGELAKLTDPEGKE